MSVLQYLTRSALRLPHTGDKCRLYAVFKTQPYQYSCTRAALQPVPKTQVPCTPYRPPNRTGVYSGNPGSSDRQLPPTTVSVCFVWGLLLGGAYLTGVGSQASSSQRAQGGSRRGEGACSAVCTASNNNHHTNHMAIVVGG